MKNSTGKNKIKPKRIEEYEPGASKQEVLQAITKVIHTPHVGPKKRDESPDSASS